MRPEIEREHAKNLDTLGKAMQSESADALAKAGVEIEGEVLTPTFAAQRIVEACREHDLLVVSRATLDKAEELPDRVRRELRTKAIELALGDVDKAVKIEEYLRTGSATPVDKSEEPA